MREATEAPSLIIIKSNRIFAVLINYEEGHCRSVSRGDQSESLSSGNGVTSGGGGEGTLENLLGSFACKMIHLI